MVKESNFPRFHRQIVMALATAVAAVGLLGAATAAAADNSAWTVTIDVRSQPPDITVVHVTASGTGCASANDLASPDMHTCQGDTVTYQIQYNGTPANSDPFVVFTTRRLFKGSPGSPDTDMVQSSGGPVTVTIGANDHTERYHVAVVDSCHLYWRDPKILVGSGGGILVTIESELAKLKESCPKESKLINKLIKEVQVLEQDLGVK